MNLTRALSRASDLKLQKVTKKCVFTNHVGTWLGVITMTNIDKNGTNRLPIMWTTLLHHWFDLFIAPTWSYRGWYTHHFRGPKWSVFGHKSAYKSMMGSTTWHVIYIFGISASRSIVWCIVEPTHSTHVTTPCPKVQKFRDIPRTTMSKAGHHVIFEGRDGDIPIRHHRLHKNDIVSVDGNAYLIL